MAVFGVPTPSDNDAANALICADMMLEALDRWNAERTRAGETALAIGIGLNTASRLQGLTRTLKTPLVAGGPLIDAIRAGSSETAAALVSQLQDQGEQALRGRAGAVRVWIRKRSGLPAATAA